MDGSTGMDETSAPIEMPTALESASPGDGGGDLGWTALDGSAAHEGIQRELYLGDFEFAETEYPVRVPDGSGGYREGRLDAYLDDRHIVDLKTHDASGWSVPDASRYGDDHGRQVAGYVASPDVEPGCQGHLALCGREPSAEAKAAYSDAATQHGVSTFWLGEYDDFGGAADQITAHVRAQEGA